MKWLAWFALLAGCDADVCAKFDGQTCVALEIRGTPTVDQIGVSLDGILAEQITPTPPREFPISLPVWVAVLPGDVLPVDPAKLQFNVRGLRFGITVGQALGELTLAPKEHRSAAITLTDLNVPLPDLAGNPDLAKPLGPAFVPANKGLNGGSVKVILADVAADGAFAGTDGAGIFKTTNRGVTWTPANKGLDGLFVRALASDDIHFTIYAALARADQTGAVFKSTDQGANWTKVTEKLCNTILPTIDSLASPVLFLGTDNGVLRSTDGLNFTPVSNGLTDLGVISLLDDTLNKGRIYAGTLSQKVFQSNDFGSSWSEIATPVTGGSGGVRSMALDPGTRDLVAATGGGLFRRSGTGSFTNFMPATPFGSPQQLAFVPSGSISLFVASLSGMFHLDTAWSNVSSGITDINVDTVALDRQDSATVWAGTFFAGAFVSTNSGSSWSPANSGITNLSVLSLAVAPSSPDVIYLGSQHAGAWKSTDGGANWTQISSGLSLGIGVRALAVHPTNPSIAYAALEDTSAGGATEGLSRTQDGGSWTLVDSTIRPSAIAIDRGNPQIVYTGNLDGTVSKATDGVHFTAFGTVGGNVSSLVIDPTNSQILYAGTFDTGVFRSGDGGAHWSAATTGISETQINSLTITDGTHLWASGFNGVYRTSNAATSWQESTSGLAGQGFNAIRAASSTVIYTASNQGIFRSDDGGASWSSRDASPFVFNVEDIAVDPRSADTAYFGYIGAVGVLKTTTGGR